MAEDYSDLATADQSPYADLASPSANIENQNPGIRINAPQILGNSLAAGPLNAGANILTPQSNQFIDRAVNDTPTAANREAIRANPYLAPVAPVANLFSKSPNVSNATINPESSPTFQNQSINSYYDFINKNPLLSRLNSRENLATAGPLSAPLTTGGFAPSAAGLGLDTYSNPLNVLLGLSGEAPVGEGRTLWDLVSQSKLGQGLSRMGNADIGKTALEAAPRQIRNWAGKMSPDDINKTIDQGISKGVRPSVAGKNTYSQSQKYAVNAREAVKTIVGRRSDLKILNNAGEETGKLPESLNEFSQAIEQTKKEIYKDYSQASKSATRKGIQIEAEPFAKNIENAANHKTVKIRFPELSKSLNNLAERLRQTSSFTPEELEDYITSLNSSLQAFYKNPNPNAVSQAVADASLAKQMRTALDDAIENSVGNGYAELKKKYGALRSIEADVNKRSVVDARKNYKGFFDLADIVSSGDIAHGLLSLNPGMLAKGAMQRSLASYFKFLNDPNRIVKNMFSAVERSYVPEISAIADKQAPKMLGYEGNQPKMLEGPKPSKLLEASNKYGSRYMDSESGKVYSRTKLNTGFERLSPEEAAAKTEARVRQVNEPLNKQKALPQPRNLGEGFEINNREDAIKKISKFANKYFSPEKKKITIPEGSSFGSKATTLLQKMGINPYTGEIKNPKLLTALEAAMKRSKGVK